jgi:hypothetical protein
LFAGAFGAAFAGAFFSSFGFSCARTAGVRSSSAAITAADDAAGKDGVFKMCIYSPSLVIAWTCGKKGLGREKEAVALFYDELLGIAASNLANH